MKKFQVIVRILMASVIMFGIETTASAQFGGLLKKAKSAVKDQVEKKGETIGNFNGHAAWLEDLVTSNCPEWGKVVASRVHNDYKVEVNALGTPIYRTFTSEVICEDQGFRVLHEVFLKQDYNGGKYGRNEIRPGGLKWNAKCSIVK